VAVRIRVQTRSGVVPAGLADLARWLADEEAWVWVDLAGDRPEAERILAEQFHFHPVIIEKCLEEVRHPRVHAFDGYLYLVAHGVKRARGRHRRRGAPPPLLSDSGELPAPPARSAPEANALEFETVELDVFLGTRYLVTYHGEPVPALDELFGDASGTRDQPIAGGPPALLREILDTLVDGYDPVLDRFDAELDVLEERILSRPVPEDLANLMRIRRSLQQLRRVNGHQQNMLLRLARGEFNHLPERERPFLRDVGDRLARVSDLTESYRETASALLEMYLSVSSNRLNEVMRTLTVVTLLLMPPTLLAGIFGMNFAHMPELRWRYGYLGALVLMGGSFVVGRWWLKRKGLWGGSLAEPGPER